METWMSILLGIGLSAACGFRVFVPLLAMGLAAQAGLFSPAPGFTWVGSTPALIILTTATLLEIGAYYVPWIDNLLDTLSIPAAVGAGALTSLAVSHGSNDPLLTWTLAAIGAGLAGSIAGGTTLTRASSTATTGGLANPLVATLENLLAFGLAALAIFVPVLAGFAVFAAIVVVARFASQALSRRRGALPHP